MTVYHGEQHSSLVDMIVSMTTSLFGAESLPLFTCMCTCISWQVSRASLLGCDIINSSPKIGKSIQGQYQVYNVTQPEPFTKCLPT